MKNSGNLPAFFEDPALRRYTADAMNTTFRIYVRDAGEAADCAVSEAFVTLARLEELLSRFIPESDVGRINAMKAGDALFISDECNACLRLALEVSAATGGYFDPCAGGMVDALKTGGAAGGATGTIALDPERPRVTCVEEGRVLDLGGIGKGFALDRLAGILAAHGVRDALLTSGGSTILGLGSAVWPVDLAHRDGTRRIGLCGAALAASGDSQQGAHIVDPGNGAAAAHYRHVWVQHPRAAQADALATACYAMPPDVLAEFIARGPAECRVFSDPDLPPDPRS